MLTDGQRIEKVVKWAGLSIHAFAIGIGLMRSENLYQIKKGNNGISRDLAERITTKYPQVSRAWLLSGEGDMLGAESLAKAENQGIPFYGMDAVAVAQARFEVQPSSWLKIDIYSDADFAASYMSDSMDTDIPLGSIIVCKRVELENIVPGASYFVVADNFIGVRYIRLGEQSQLKLVAANAKQYDPMSIERSQIERLYLVRGIIITKSF